MNRVFNKFNAFIVLLLVLWLFTSCDATKRVKADEYLLTKTSINVDGKKRAIVKLSYENPAIDIAAQLGLM